jgi:hypothetical protein
MKSKKATIGATMTWVVATIIILVVIILFVYAAKAQMIGSTKGSFYTRYKLTEISKEQMLLALLETEVDGKKVEQHINDAENKEDYEVLGKKIEPILEKFPGLDGGNWVFIIYEDGKSKLQVGKVYSSARDINPSFVYYSNKKIELGFDYLGVGI